ncbi:hypothetical protein FOA52_008382 [Chlamydomonas sp. UWO 241]|nr:hypothetical protein FOA52_008382 [Chlamydomonas sp. UWO 241]
MAPSRSGMRRASMAAMAQLLLLLATCAAGTQELKRWTGGEYKGPGAPMLPPPPPSPPPPLAPLVEGHQVADNEEQPGLVATAEGASCFNMPDLGFDHKGCFKDLASPATGGQTTWRSMGLCLQSEGPMSVLGCAELAAAANKTFFAVSPPSYCFASNSIVVAQLLGLADACVSECNDTATGVPAICGSTRTISVYGFTLEGGASPAAFNASAVRAQIAAASESGRPPCGNATGATNTTDTATNTPDTDTTNATDTTGAGGDQSGMTWPPMRPKAPPSPTSPSTPPLLPPPPRAPPALPPPPQTPPSTPQMPLTPQTPPRALSPPPPRPPPPFTVAVGQLPLNSPGVLSNYDIAAVLQVHNQRRAVHSAPPLTWNSMLADMANKWAKECLFWHSDYYYGENIALGGTSSNAAQLAARWYDEEVCDYDYNNPGFSHTAGHFTQVGRGRCASVCVCVCVS